IKSPNRKLLLRLPRSRKRLRHPRGGVSGGANALGNADAAIAAPCELQSGILPDPLVNRVDQLQMPNVVLGHGVPPPSHMDFQGLSASADEFRQLLLRGGDELTVIEIDRLRMQHAA